MKEIEFVFRFRIVYKENTLRDDLSNLQLLEASIFSSDEEG